MFGSISSLGGLSMQLAVKRKVEKTFRSPTEVRKKSFFTPASDHRGITPPWVVEPLTSHEAVAQTLTVPKFIPTEPEVKVLLSQLSEWEGKQPDPSDFKRASDLRQYLKNQGDDRVAKVAWLEAFAGFNDEGLAKDRQPLVPVVPVQTITLKDAWYFNKTFFVQGGVYHNVPVSGLPCIPVPRNEYHNKEGLKEFISGPRRNKVKVGKNYATLLDEGDFFGPHSGDQRPHTTMLNAIAAQEASEKFHKLMAEKRKHLKVVEPSDKGQYKGPYWDRSTMSNSTAVQGTEHFVRPPTLIELFADHAGKMKGCGSVNVQYEYKSSVQSIDAAGNPCTRTEVVNWKQKDGAALGPTVMDTDPPLLTDVVAANDDLSLYATPISSEEIATQVLQPAVAKVTPQIFPATSMTDAEAEWCVLRKRKERTWVEGSTLIPAVIGEQSSAPTMISFGMEQFVGPPTVHEWKWLGTRHYTISRNYVQKDEERRWCYTVGEDSDKTRYLSWLEDVAVHNDLKRDAGGFRQGRLLLKAICGAGAQVDSSMYGLGADDEERYDLWFSTYGDLAYAKSRSCVHQAKRLTMAVPPVSRLVAVEPSEVKSILGPTAPLTKLDQVRLVMDYVEMENLPPITLKELEDWFDEVAIHFGGCDRAETIYLGFLNRQIKRKELEVIEESWLKPVEPLPSFIDYKMSSPEGIFVPGDMIVPEYRKKIVLPVTEVQLTEEVEIIESELYQDLMDEFKNRTAIETYQSPLDRVLNVFKRKE